MDRVCRICMSGAGDLIDIFVSYAESPPSLEEMINECVEVKISREDQYPKQICEICMGDVHCAYRFKKNYQLTLDQLSKTSTINITEEPKNTTSKQDTDSKTTKTKQKQLRVPKKISNVKTKRIKIALKFNGKNKTKTKLESKLKEANLNKNSELKLNVKEVKHACVICGKEFPKKVGLSTHMHKMHNEHINRNMRVVKCPNCHKYFAFKHTLKKHLIRQVCTKEAMGPSEKENIESSGRSIRKRKHIA